MDKVSSLLMIVKCKDSLILAYLIEVSQRFAMMKI